MYAPVPPAVVRGRNLKLKSNRDTPTSTLVSSLSLSLPLLCTFVFFHIRVRVTLKDVRWGFAGVVGKKGTSLDSRDHRHKGGGVSTAKGAGQNSTYNSVCACVCGGGKGREGAQALLSKRPEVHPCICVRLHLGVSSNVLDAAFVPSHVVQHFHSDSTAIAPHLLLRQEWWTE